MKNILVVLMLFTLSSPLLAGEGKEETYIRQGTDYLANGDFKKASKAFENAIGLNPQRPESHAGLGMSFLKLGHNEAMTNPELLEKAVAAFRRALDLNPNLPEARYALGLTHLALYNKNAAVKEYEALKGLDAELAGKLLIQINAFTPPAHYKPVGSTKEEAATPRPAPYPPPSSPPGVVISIPESEGRKELREQREREEQRKHEIELEKARRPRIFVPPPIVIGR